MTIGVETRDEIQSIDKSPDEIYFGAVEQEGGSMTRRRCNLDGGTHIFTYEINSQQPIGNYQPKLQLKA